MSAAGSSAPGTVARPLAIGICSMKRGTRPRCQAHAAMPASSSSLKPRSATVLSLIDAKPAARAASIPATTRASSPRRVMRRKRSASSESRLTFRRSTPAARNGAASSGNRCPFVDSAMSSSRGARAAGAPARQVAADGRLAAGQTDAPDAEPDEHAHQRGGLLEAEHLLARGVPDAVVRDAVAAAVVAAIGDGDAQVVDHARLGIDAAPLWPAARARGRACSGMAAPVPVAAGAAGQPRAPARAR